MLSWSVPRPPGRTFSGSALLAACLLGGAVAVRAAASDPDVASRTLTDVIPLTAGNLRGHRTLYREGWFVVSSSEKAFAYAREHAITASGDALAAALRDAGGRTAALPGRWRDDAVAGVDTARRMFEQGSERSGAILHATGALSAAELRLARQGFERAASRFVRGNLALRQRTADERRQLMALPGRYFEQLQADYSNLGELAAAAGRRFGGAIEVGWSAAFARAREEFRQQYERSGEAANTLQGLGPILYGYLQSIYHGLLAPGSRAAAKGAAGLVSEGVFRPTAMATLVAGRTVEAVGMSVFYAGKAGVEIVAPTIEAGLLGGLSLLSLAAVPVTVAGGGAFGAINQIAFTAAAPVAGTTHAAGAAAIDTAAVVGLVAYDAAKGTTQVLIHQAQAGVVLGYNALTAIPTHFLLGVADGAVFLAWDGPRLVIAVARGAIGAAGAGHAGDLPVGTVVDLGALRQEPGVLVDILSTDPQVIGEVIRRLPCDLNPSAEAGACPR